VQFHKDNIMHIKYKIIKVVPEEHSIVVRFYTDTPTSNEDALATRNPDTGTIIRNPDGTIESCRTDYNITLWQVPTLTGRALADEISRHAPKTWFELRESIANPLTDTGLTGVQSLVGVESLYAVSAPTSTENVFAVTAGEVVTLV